MFVWFALYGKAEVRSFGRVKVLRQVRENLSKSALQQDGKKRSADCEEVLFVLLVVLRLVAVSFGL